MIKNRQTAATPPRQRSLALAALAIAAAACNGPEPSVPSPYQGVIELDRRVLAFELGGRIETIEVARGDRVTPGQRLASLDDALAAPTRAARVAELDLARAQLALVEAGARPQDLSALEAQVRALRATERTAQALLDRQRLLVADRAAPAATLDELEGRLRAATAQRQAAAHQLDSARAGARAPEIAAATARVTALEAALELEDRRQDKFALVAPTAGVVLDLLADPGEVAAPGTPILVLGDRDHPYVDVFVATDAVVQLTVGQAAEVLVDGIEAALSGRIEHIAAETEFTPRYVFSRDERQHLVVRVRVRLADPEHRIHPGLPAFARFEALPSLHLEPSAAAMDTSP